MFLSFCEDWNLKVGRGDLIYLAKFKLAKQEIEVLWAIHGVMFRNSPLDSRDQS